MKQSAAFVMCVCLAMAGTAMAQEQRPLPLGDLQVSADTLGSIVLGQNVKLMMRDGTLMEGVVIRTSREEIAMQVKKTIPKVQVRGGQANLRTSDIATVFMMKNGSVVAPAALGVFGGILGLYAGVYAGYRSCSGPILFVGMLGGAAGGAAAGAYAGHEIAKKTVTISVVPADR